MLRRILLSAIAAAVLACVCTGAGRAQENSVAPAANTEAWHTEFDEICSRTHDAMTYTPEELTSLIARCDALMPQIQKLDETRRKVFTTRLRMCRGLYAYVLESKQSEKK